MKKALIVYFSQSGTNQHIAETISAGLREGGVQAGLWNLKDGPAPALDDIDLLGIGSPTYYYRPPFNVIDYVKSLPDLSGRSTFVFVVHGTYRGSTGDMIRRTLTRKNAREVGYFHCRGATFFLGYLKEGFLFSPDHPSAEEIKRAEIFGRDITARLAGKPYTRAEVDPPLQLIYRLERLLAHRTLVKQIYSRSFTVNETCRPDCDICIRQCPVNNITRGKDGRLAWGRDCLLCLSCEMKCPEDAITSPVSWPVFKPFLIYNTKHASCDPALDHAKVIHAKGQTKRL
jgi:flavodoxin/NAD-dependent dihydropyrimidine dehydrogenase PreA subunit